ncbi:MAG: anthranilate synthase component I family protein [candidate division Zixibacteria bacterium]|nr:anthranilate synthase component I family protein [candidate division Zixibacteria bacterium]
MVNAIIRPVSAGINLENLFGKLASKRGAVWLDSSLRIGDKGSASFIAFDPVIEVSVYENSIEIKSEHKSEKIQGAIDPLKLLNDLWETENLFSVGYFSYESTLPFVGLRAGRQSDLPLIHFYFYDTHLKFDHFANSYELIGNNPARYADILTASEAPENHLAVASADCRPTISKNDYLRSVRKIKEHIKEGDIYQANFTCGFDVKSDALAFDTYKRLRRLNPAPYAAYLNFGDYQILSSSPERMFKKVGLDISSCPIKGTITSGRDDFERQQNRLKLLNSEKDKAELLMIVDLVRNDLGKVAETGTVRVDNLFEPEDYSSLIHLVTDISAKLRNDLSLADIIKALLPGGSITGAPKKRAVEIIQEIETTPRGVYTGCIGYVDGDQAEFNIAIRTMTYQDSFYRINSGGGIVSGSSPESEYEEMLLKAKNLLRALGAAES